MDFDERLIFEGKLSTFEEGYNIGRKILLNPHRDFDAIITINDVIALGVLRAAKEFGLLIPEDFSLAGYDDVIFASIAEVPLTTVAQPTREIGEKSVEILLKRIEGNIASDNYIHIFLQPKLIIRSSCRTHKLVLDGKSKKIEGGGER
ncbi:LacI family DNA-binding transcriptional regulator [Candidatus Aerophobetes bacterium]|nr:LacI family DNA-binding transcriptional regulator [Candidatus Aerophobetes bacterium]